MKKVSFGFLVSVFHFLPICLFFSFLLIYKFYFLFYIGPGSPPRYVSLTSISSYSVLVTWASPFKPNGYIIQYSVHIDYLNGSGVSIPVFKNEFEIMGLSPYQLIEVQVSAWTAIGEGPRSDLKMVRTEEASKYLFTC